MTEEEKTAAIEAYLRGELRGAALERWERQLAADPGLQADLALHRELQEALGDSPLQALRRTAQTVLQDSRSPAPARLNRWWGLVIAALVLALSALAFWHWRQQKTTPQQLFARHFQPPATLGMAPYQRSEDTSSLTWRDQLDSLYRAKNYPATAAILEQQAQRPGLRASSDLYFQLGLVYLIQQKPELALQALNQVEIGHPYEKAWYTALARLLGPDPAGARAELQRIAGTEGPFRQKAAELLRHWEE